MKWINIDEIPEEYYGNKKEVLLKTLVGIVSAWYDPETLEWVCYDDMFSLHSDDCTIIKFSEFDNY